MESGVLTKVGGVVVLRAAHVAVLEEGHDLVRGALVHAVAGAQHVHVVELLEQGGGRLVDGAHHGAPAAR